MLAVENRAILVEATIDKLLSSEWLFPERTREMIDDLGTKSPMPKKLRLRMASSPCWIEADLALRMVRRAAELTTRWPASRSAGELPVIESYPREIIAWMVDEAGDDVVDDLSFHVRLELALKSVRESLDLLKHCIPKSKLKRLEKAQESFASELEALRLLQPASDTFGQHGRGEWHLELANAVADALRQQAERDKQAEPTKADIADAAIRILEVVGHEDIVSPASMVTSITRAERAASKRRAASRK